MKKTWVEFLSEKGLTISDLSTKTAGELASLHQSFSDERIANLEQAIKAESTKEDVTFLKSELERVKNELISSMTKIKSLEETPKDIDSAKQTVRETLFKSYKENENSIKDSKNKTFEFVVKADTLRSSIVGNPNAVILQEVGQLAHRKLTVYDIFPKFTVPANNNGTVKYVDWDEATTVRAAAAIAEGTVFPASTAKWVTRTISIEKVGDMIPVSEETLYDAGLFASELEGFLNTNVDIKIDTDLISGDNIAPNINGLKNQIPVYTPVASGIAGANIYDLIVKLREAISGPYGAKYNVNVALMNIADISDMKLEKDANLNYILPPFYDRTGNVVDGITVIECNSFAANTMAVGDSRYGRIYEAGGIIVETGRATGDFESDMVTIKARKRLNLLIRNVDKTGWLQVTSISSALTTLGTV